MKITLLMTAIAGMISLTLAGCDPSPPSPVNVDAPQLASSLKWVGCCAVACSALGGTALVIASRNRNRRK